MQWGCTLFIPVSHCGGSAVGSLLHVHVKIIVCEYGAAYRGNPYGFFQ